MSAPDRFIAWCKQEQASIQQQLELMEAAKVLTGENLGSGWVETTAESIARAKARLAELESLLTETGAATTHQYTVIEPFTALEATAPPAEGHGRDAPG